MTNIMISCAFGVTSFCLILLVFLQKGKRLRAAAVAPQGIIDFGAASVVASARLQGVDGGEFLPISKPFELTLPEVGFGFEKPASLQFGGPLRQRLPAIVRIRAVELKLPRQL